MAPKKIKRLIESIRDLVYANQDKLSIQELREAEIELDQIMESYYERCLENNTIKNMTVYQIQQDQDDSCCVALLQKLKLSIKNSIDGIEFPI